MDKHYSTDPAKSKSRNLVKDIIQRTLLKYRKPQDLRVLCFPGIDAQEIIEVYDQLKIPRQNIIGLEREKDIAQTLTQKNLGIQIIHDSVEDYLTKQPSLAFDIISLDYTGPLVLSQMQTLKKIREKQHKKEFILHNANLIKRDKFALEMYRYGYAINTPVELGNLSVGPRHDHQQIYDRTLHALKDGASEDTRKEIRQEGYTRVILSCLYGANHEFYNHLLRFYAGSEYKEILELFQNQINQKRKTPLTLDPNDPIGSISAYPTFPFMQKQLDDLIWWAHQEDCKRHGIFDPANQHLLWYAIHQGAKQTQFFQERDLECYTYISESGSPMIGDVIYLKSMEPQASIARDILRFIGYPDAFQIKTNYDQRRFQELFKEYIKTLRRMDPDPTQIENVVQKEQNRQFLGSSYRPTLSKARAIAEFKEGATLQELQQKYRNHQDLPLAQWKAHVTMGTYDQKPTPSSSTLDEISDVPIEKITKEDVIDLLHLNLPPEEIFNVYPTSFTLGQLRAFKAHHTMGTYS